MKKPGNLPKSNALSEIGKRLIEIYIIVHKTAVTKIRELFTVKINRYVQCWLWHNETRKKKSVNEHCICLQDNIHNKITTTSESHKFPYSSLSHYFVKLLEHVRCKPLTKKKNVHVYTSALLDSFQVLTHFLFKILTTRWHSCMQAHKSTNPFNVTVSAGCTALVHASFEV
jgi:hypothetical protein